MKTWFLKIAEVASTINLSSGLFLEGVTLCWSSVSGYKQLEADHCCNPKAEVEQYIFRCGLSVKKSQWFNSNVSCVCSDNQQVLSALVAFPNLHLSSSDPSAQCLHLSLLLMLWRITFQCQYFLKGMGYLRWRLYVQGYDSCSTVDGPSRVGCESSLLLAKLLVFSAVHQRLISHGGQQEGLGYRRGIPHRENCAPGAKDSRVILLEKERSPRGAPGATREQMLEKPNAPMLAPLFFHILPASVWQLITSSAVNQGLYQCTWEQILGLAQSGSFLPLLSDQAPAVWLDSA